MEENLIREYITRKGKGREKGKRKRSKGRKKKGNESIKKKRKVQGKEAESLIFSP